MKVWGLTDAALPDLVNKNKGSYVLSGDLAWMSIYPLIKPKLGVDLCFVTFCDVTEFKFEVLERKILQNLHLISQGKMVICGIFSHGSRWAHAEAKWMLEVRLQYEGPRITSSRLHNYFLLLSMERCISPPFAFPPPYNVSSLTNENTAGAPLCKG